MHEDLWISVSIISVGALLALGYAFALPNWLVINAQGIVVYYAFGTIQKKATWEDVKCIDERYSKHSIFPWLREYHIGYFQTTFPLWEKARIPKNKKTTHLLTQFCEKRIEKFS